MFTEILLARGGGRGWWRFHNPFDVVSVRDVADVYPALQRLEARVEAEQCYAVGFVGYEAAPGFDAALTTRPAGRLPLLWFGLFHAPEQLDELAPGDSGRSLPDWRNPQSVADYEAAVQGIRDEIAAGNVYQINYTLQLRADRAPGREWFANVAADAPYGAYLEGDEFAIACASPELFFELDGRHLRSRPMKGTAARGLTLQQDLAQRDWLAVSEKNRAENLMITDMVRNDFGRIAEIGSVAVQRLFEIEKFPTVWQMTSDVVAQTDACVADVFAAAFPGASITGAPKRAAMEQIARLEDSPREIYTGSIGYLAPGRQARFNIAIRTAWSDKAAGHTCYGVGGGIVWDSEPSEERHEIAAKSQVLRATRATRNFELLETLRWDPEAGLGNWEWHLRRLADSACYFDFAMSRSAVCEAVEAAVAALPPVCHRVRVRVARGGEVAVDHEPLHLRSGSQALRLADAPVSANDPFLYHKTTNRAVYERAAASAGPGEEVLLHNTAGFVTESTIANLAYETSDGLFTPPVSDGLLPGTLRARELANGTLRERQLPVAELGTVRKLYLLNSLRGWRDAHLVGEGKPDC